MNNSALLSVWVRQQKELGMPDPVLPRGADFVRSLHAAAPLVHGRTAVPGPAARTPGSPSAVTPMSTTGQLARLRKLTPPAKMSLPSAPAQQVVSADTAGPLTFEQKRALFKELYLAKCARCPLERGRKNFVFGAGNVDAPLMIIGEAPGAEEDAQGLPFVGQAGRLLTEMLTSVSLDRKRDVFITNILKCRPPGNRTPESAEILACLPLVEKQIAIARPRFLLLLGRIAAHSLLEISDSIMKMRGKTQAYKGIPAIVTYHPAAILRNPEYRRPTDDDFQKIAAMLKESGYHGAT